MTMITIFERLVQLKLTISNSYKEISTFSIIRNTENSKRNTNEKTRTSQEGKLKLLENTKEEEFSKK